MARAVSLLTARGASWPAAVAARARDATHGEYKMAGSSMLMSVAEVAHACSASSSATLTVAADMGAGRLRMGSKPADPRNSRCRWSGPKNTDRNFARANFQERAQCGEITCEEGKKLSPCVPPPGLPGGPTRALWALAAQHAPHRVRGAVTCHSRRRAYGRVQGFRVARRADELFARAVRQRARCAASRARLSLTPARFRVFPVCAPRLS